MKAETIELLQRACQSEGFYTYKVDGLRGPKTDAAMEKLVLAWDSVQPVTEITSPNPDFDASPADARSEGVISGLLPEVRPRVRGLLNLAKAAGITMIVTSGYRTYEEQAKLHAAHLKGGPQATSPGNSNHNFALAVDLTKFVDGKPVWESPDYAKVGAMAEKVGLYWGGHFGDEPHFEYRPDWSRNLSESQMMAGLRARHADGKSALA